jgi:alpha-tubulin suppressor-like RCC1 family protein
VIAATEKQLQWTSIESSAVHHVEGATEVVDVGLGANFACALRLDGSVWCWGLFGTAHSPRAARPIISGGASALGVGSSQACAAVEGDVFCWGASFGGQLWDGATRVTTDEPRKIQGAGGVSILSAGSYHVCAQTAARKLLCWGANHQEPIQPLKKGPELLPPTPVHHDFDIIDFVCAGFVTCVVGEDGTPRCQGGNIHGMLGDGTRTGRGTARPVLWPPRSLPVLPVAGD